MNCRRGFDNDRYRAEQKSAILDRVERFNNKLYLDKDFQFSLEHRKVIDLVG